MGCRSLQTLNLLDNLLTRNNPEQGRAAWVWHTSPLPHPSLAADSLHMRRVSVASLGASLAYACGCRACVETNARVSLCGTPLLSAGHRILFLHMCEYVMCEPLCTFCRPGECVACSRRPQSKHQPSLRRPPLWRGRCGRTCATPALRVQGRGRSLACEVRRCDRCVCVPGWAGL